MSAKQKHVHIFLVLLLTSHAMLMEPALCQPTAGAVDLRKADSAVKPRKYPPDILGYGFGRKKNMRLSKSDATLAEIAAPVIPEPLQLPPFPEQLDLDIRLLKPEQSSVQPLIGTKVVADISPDGTVEQTIVLTNGAATTRGTIASRALEAEKRRKSGGVKEAFQQYAEIVNIAPNGLSTEEQYDLAKCHKALGEILYTYGIQALNFKRLETGRARLLNAWIEYRRALFLNPNDKQVQAQLLAISKYAVEQVPTFENWLAYGSSLMLTGEKTKAKQCYKQCRKLQPDSRILNRLPR